MKLVLANNQSDKFKNFHTSIQGDKQLYDYTGYKSLLFEFGMEGGKPVAKFKNVNSGKSSQDYTAAYINGYLSCPELAAAVAIVFDAHNTPYVNRELKDAPSLTKLTMHGKLAAGGVKTPKTYGAAAYALKAAKQFVDLNFPAVLKRADADRGVDNFKVYSYEEVQTILKDQPELSLWILQEFIPNNGYYLVSVYDSRAAFGIFRSLQNRPDNNRSKSHMFKPKGGANADLITAEDLPASVLSASIKAAETLGRQIASVDSIYDESTGAVYVLEVNYNPQLVTIETFKQTRVKAFVEAMDGLGENR